MYCNTESTLVIKASTPNTVYQIPQSYAYVSKASQISTTGMKNAKGNVLYIPAAQNPSLNLGAIYDEIKPGRDYVIISGKQYVITDVVNGLYGSANMHHLELSLT